jgi:hypothetical protein
MHADQGTPWRNLSDMVCVERCTSSGNGMVCQDSGLGATVAMPVRDVLFE